MERYLEDLSGKYCRFISILNEKQCSVLQESEIANYDFGTLSDINKDNRFIQVRTKNGLKKINIEDLIEVVPMTE